MISNSQKLSYKARNLLESEQNALLSQVRWFIAPYLHSMKLAREQIEQQNLEDLKVSLNTIEQAISNSEGWPKFGVKFDSKAGIVITKTSAAKTISKLLLCQYYWNTKGLSWNV